jgi:hypothetical protein
MTETKITAAPRHRSRREQAQALTIKKHLRKDMMVYIHGCCEVCENCAALDEGKLL